MSEQQSTEATKACPFCGEKILVVAVKCKHCGSDLQSSPGGQKTNKPPQSEVLGWILLLVPSFVVVMIWAWIGQMSLIQNPGSTLNGLGVLTIFGTAVLAAVEAGRLGMGQTQDLTPKGKKREGPIAWFFTVALLWIIGYPLYLHRRRLYGVKSRLVLGMIIVVAFVFSWASMASAIESKLDSIRSSFGN